MTTPNTIDAAQISIRQTAPRMTAQPPLRSFGEVLATRGEAILQTALRTVGFVPGASLLTAAVRGPGSTTTTVGAASPEAPAANAGAGSTTGTTGDDLLARNQEMSMQYLQLQEQISQENRQYTALSNVLHVRHESAKNAIGNVR